ncbi:uncharacterized protein L201_001182 [Kwoniella dendrophila CBS 6074]|uniref:Uncharacterized protein n=1 Tax=Kwoniella dendrophila CBS 6074 TaxID=1295534 RepID=A0AAX4JLM0_9TREE
MLEDMSNSPSTSRRRPKSSQENWDDDFEFTLPTRRSTNKSTTNNTSKSVKGKEKDENVPLSREESPIEDWDENWDESPPRPAPIIPIATHTRKKSSIPPPINIPSSSSSSRMNPPRLSPSHSNDLYIGGTSPIPSSSFSSPKQPLLPSKSHSSIGLSNVLHQQQQQQLPRHRSGSTATNNVTKNKLIKRHPSTSFVPIPSHSSSNLALNTGLTNHSEASLSSVSLINRSSPNLPQNNNQGSPSLPRSISGEQMPPPPLPQTNAGSGGGLLGRARSRSKSKPRPESRQDIRISSIPFSPSRDDMKSAAQTKEKKPGFWKRFSGVPASERNDGTPQHRRRRSSSVGAKHIPSNSPRPPVPPLPVNLRSPSGASSTSTSSAKSGPTSAFSALLRRSSSSLSKRSDRSRDTPPSSYPYLPSRHGASSSSINSIIEHAVPIPSTRGGDVTPDLPSSASFSRGFHLPSPSPGSPYHAPKSPMPSFAPEHPAIPPLPHSTSFPGPQAPKSSGSDTETEGDSKTPKRRKKVRPVSALPAPRTTSGFSGNNANWGGFDNEPRPQIPGLPIIRQTSVEFSSTRSSDSPSGFASSTSSTLKRLGSLSKKHGRRLSGGWKFGTNSSTDSNKSGIVTPLEPVVGSPSKPYNRPDDGLPLSPISPTPDPSSEVNASTEEDMRKAIRAGSLSAPTSMFKSTPPISTTQTVDTVPQTGSTSSIKEKEKKDKHRRRQSWNDFVIPREVMMKQKELKEGIGAVKMFAGGVSTLKTLLSTHANIRDRILASGSSSDAANFASLDSEFEQWLEMAVVLIEVGSTGSDPANQPSFSSPPRSRRITLASDEAKAASAAMSKAVSAPGGSAIPPVQLSSWRKASLPDPEDTTSLSMIGPGPPKAEIHPEQWRASTGRQDLSKRQLEVLRTMLRTPMSSTNLTTPEKERPGMGQRTPSTLSAASSTTTNSYLQVQRQGSPSPDTKYQKQSQIGRKVSTRGVTPDSISFPSPNDSAHIKPSDSFPSPISAARLSQPSQKNLKERRASKAGLAGLKEFLRSLKKDRVPSGNSTTSGGGLSPLRIKSRFKPKNSTSPPASPTSPLSPHFSSNNNNNNKNDVFYPTQKSTFSALGTGTGTGTISRASTIDIQSSDLNVPQTPQTAPLDTFQSQFQSQSRSGSGSGSGSQSRARSGTKTSPRIGGIGSEQKRPSIRNIFRTSSGNWSDLVNSSPSSISTSTVTTNESPSPGGLSKKLSAQRLGFGSSTKLTSTSKISVSDPIPSKIPLSPSSKTLTGLSNDYNPSFSGFGVGSQLGSGGMSNEGEMTLRPNQNTAKKRVSGLGLGLGWPENSASSSSGSVNSSPIKSSQGNTSNTSIGEMGTVYENNENGNTENTLVPSRSHSVRNTKQSNSPNKDRFPSNRTFTSNSTSTSSSNNRIPSNESSYFSHIPPPQDIDGNKEIRTSEESKIEINEKDLTIALTPENLPTLLEYLRQCERMLNQWKDKIEQVIPIDERIKI